VKILFTLFAFLIAVQVLSSQTLPNLPIPIGAGNAEVWNDAIYLFGGSDDWSGTTVYPRIYRFDGNNWAYHDTIPDDMVWDVEALLAGNYVYLLGGWLGGESLNRRYNLNTGEWTYLANSPNTYQDWGLTSEVLGEIIYLFNSYGEVFAYNITSNAWTNKTSNSAAGSWDMSSILYQGEIYMIGWDLQEFYKYVPSVDQWIRLADSPYQVGACAFGIINNLIYAIGGNVGGSSWAEYQSIIVYDITANSWTIDTLEISSKRHWMATAEYRGGLYVVGGIDEFANAVDIVEQIVPQGTAGVNSETEIINGYFLDQNYPNPFNPSTKISWQSPIGSQQTLKIYDILGNEIATLVDEYKLRGKYQVEFDASSLPSGVYFYQLKAVDPSTGSGQVYVSTKKMILLK
jgi:hypothetical protein